MPHTLLAKKRPAPLAKLSPPRVPAVVERIRLYRLLDRARRRPVVWIAAPPGFGKTTLVTSYLRARKLRTLWYQIDAGDQDLASFFHYLGLAAQHAAPRYRRPLPHLTPEYLQGLPTFTRRFFEALCQRLRTPAVLVLDNYQEMPAEAQFHDMVALGLEAVPAGISVIVMSRASPPSSLARLQAAQHVSFIDEEDLRLTKAEARAIVRLHGGSTRLAKATLVETLHDKLQGWVAGLVLQLEQAKADVTHEAIGSRETPQVIFDYLAREVMQRLSLEAQRLLLCTAFLPDMTTAMAEQLTGLASAGDILSDLYRSRYFTERRSATATVYQYHPLFREFLRAQAKRLLPPDQVTGIQQKAAMMLEEAGQIEDAVRLYGQAGLPEHVVRIVLSNAAELLMQGRAHTLEEWLRRIPTDFYDQQPWLHYWLGASRMAADPLECEGHFERAFRQFKQREDHIGELMALAGIVSTLQLSWIDIGRFDRWIDILLRMVPADATFPSKEIEVQITFCMMTALMWRRPSRTLVDPWLQRAKGLLEGTTDIEKYSLLSAGVAHVFAWIGDLESAEKYSNILEPAAESETASPLVRLLFFANKAVLGWHRGDARSTMTTVERGLTISKQTGVYVFDTTLLGSGVYGALLRNDLALAEQCLRQTTPLVRHPASLNAGALSVAASVGLPAEG